MGSGSSAQKAAAKSEHAQQLRAIFDLLDVDNDGTLTREELVIMQMTCSTAEQARVIVEKMIEEVDGKGEQAGFFGSKIVRDGKIDVKELGVWFERQKWDAQDLQRIHRGIELYRAEEQKKKNDSATATAQHDAPSEVTGKNDGALGSDGPPDLPGDAREIETTGVPTEAVPEPATSSEAAREDDELADGDRPQDLLGNAHESETVDAPAKAAPEPGQASETPVTLTADPANLSEKRLAVQDDVTEAAPGTS